MNAQEIYSVFLRDGILLQNDHFMYSSGLHGSSYLNKRRIYADSRLTSRLGRALAHEARTYDLDIQCVVGPEKGGIILSQWTGYFLSCWYQRDVITLFADKSPDEDGFIFIGGYGEMIKNLRVLIVDDVINIGTSIKNLAHLVTRSGGKVQGALALYNRGYTDKQDFGDISLVHSFVYQLMPSYTLEQCPMCIAGKSINAQFGRGKDLVLTS